MTSLKERLRNHITDSGPLTISQFISLCLADKQQGYYHHASPFGVKGDFITAPEVSQMFGEMLSLWVLSTWQQMGAPQKFVLCEMGPGRGTLMDDMIRCFKKLMPDFLKYARIILIETSHSLRSVIAEKLKSHSVEIEFANHIEDLPPLSLILIGNELLDCLPIHQYIKTKKGWFERVVALDATGDLCFALSPYQTDLALLSSHADHVLIGEMVETSPAREGLITQLSQHLVTQGGGALFIDYGSLTSGFGDTLQALSKHEYQNPLTAPGCHDLTSHVDFARLSAIAQGSGCASTMMTQAAFLKAFGIESRAKRLSRGQTSDVQAKIMLDLERLISPQEMGELFKVLILSSPF